MSVFSGKTHNLQTQKYDINMSSLVAKNILIFNAGILVSFLTLTENFVEI